MAQMLMVKGITDGIGLMEAQTILGAPAKTVGEPAGMRVDAEA